VFAGIARQRAALAQRRTGPHLHQSRGLWAVPSEDVEAWLRWARSEAGGGERCALKPGGRAHPVSPRGEIAEYYRARVPGR
jgi:hypothetical protein